jgi:hypothetical protein
MENETLKLFLKEKIVELKKLPYQELCQFMDNAKTEKYGEGDSFYQIEVSSFWDDGKGETKNLRVVASVDNGGARAFFLPFTEDFIITPDGRFI